jgi:hypothetical protein
MPNPYDLKRITITILIDTHGRIGPLFLLQQQRL